MNNPDDDQSPSGSAEFVDAAVLEEAAGRDKRSAAQRNHDAFAAMLEFVVSSGGLGRHSGLPAQVIATMTPDELESETGIATTASGGALPVKDALTLAGAGRPFLALLDGRDRPLFLGRRRRLASADQRIALIAADRGCTRPGCDQPADRCEVHHIDEWVDGGRTDVTVMTLACGGDHGNVHAGEGGWMTDLIDTVTETGGLPDGRAARIGWTQRGTGDRLRGNTVHQPQRYVDCSVNGCEPRWSMNSFAANIPSGGQRVDAGSRSSANCPTRSRPTGANFRSLRPEFRRHGDGRRRVTDPEWTDAASL